MIVELINVGIWLIPVLVAIVSIVIVTGLDTRSGEPKKTDDIPSPITRVLDMGPQCAQAAGVYKMNEERSS